MEKENNKERANLPYNFDNINSKYILKQILEYLPLKKALKIFKINKKAQNRLDIGINDYINFGNIVIELIPNKTVFGKFIHIKENKSYFKIYFNDNIKKAIKRYQLNDNEKVNKITIIISYKIKKVQFQTLFYDCKCIESINIINHKKRAIANMDYMWLYFIKNSYI